MKKLGEGPELPCRSPKDNFTKINHTVQNKVEKVP